MPPAINASEDVSSSLAQSDLTRSRGTPDGLHGAGAMDPIEDRLVITHLFDEAFQGVVRYDRRCRIIRVPNIETLPRLEIDVVPMGDLQIPVGVQDIQQAVQFIREQDVVVGAKGTVGRFDGGEAELHFLMDWDRGVVNFVNDVEPATPTVSRFSDKFSPELESRTRTGNSSRRAAR